MIKTDKPRHLAHKKGGERMNIHAIQTPKPEKKEKVRVSWNPNLTDEEALALNKQLMEACLACDFAGVEALLEQGADPLGSCTADGHGKVELVLESLFMEAIHFGDSEDANRMGKALPELVRIFLAHGMDIPARQAAMDKNDDNYIRPLWDLAFCSNEAGLKTLSVFLEHGLDPSSAEDLVEHILVDFDFCYDSNGKDDRQLTDDDFQGETFDDLKMVMLAASYPDVLNNSPYLQECVDLTENDPEKLIGFRNWNDFDYRIDWSVRREPPGVLIAGLLTIRDRRTGEDVWNVIV